MKQTKSYLLGLKHGKSHTVKVKTFRTASAKADYNAGYKAGRCSKTMTVKGLNTVQARNKSLSNALSLYKTVFAPSNNWLASFDSKVSVVKQLSQEKEQTGEIAPTDVHVRYQIKKSYNKV